MTKKIKTLIGLGVVGVGIYFIWKQNQKQKIFQNAIGKNYSNPNIVGVPTNIK
jgi:hypothetical protein